MPVYISAVAITSTVRVRNFTQSDWPEAWIGGGGAGNFKRFLSTELILDVERRYRTAKAGKWTEAVRASEQALAFATEFDHPDHPYFIEQAKKMLNGFKQASAAGK